MTPASGGSRSHSVRQFRRLFLLRLFPLTIPVALAISLIFPPGPALWVAVVVTMLGIVVFVVPYKSDEVIFGAEGEISVGRQTLRPADFSRCRYRKIVGSGRAFRLSGFALYGETNGNGVPELFVPVHGWLRSDRIELFSALSAWLDAAAGDLDRQSRQRLDELTRA